jgi:hypothetical protein
MYVKLIDMAKSLSNKAFSSFSKVSYFLTHEQKLYQQRILSQKCQQSSQKQNTIKNPKIKKIPQGSSIWHNYCLYIVGKKLDCAPNKKGEQDE